MIKFVRCSVEPGGLGGNASPIPAVARTTAGWPGQARGRGADRSARTRPVQDGRRWSRRVTCRPVELKK
eukprot:5918638-Pleurochrysis_carterae.AAC.1